VRSCVEKSRDLGVRRRLRGHKGARCEGADLADDVLAAHHREDARDEDEIGLLGDGDPYCVCTGRWTGDNRHAVGVQRRGECACEPPAAVCDDGARRSDRAERRNALSQLFVRALDQCFVLTPEHLHAVREIEPLFTSDTCSEGGSDSRLLGVAAAVPVGDGGDLIAEELSLQPLAGAPPDLRRGAHGSSSSPRVKMTRPLASRSRVAR
jgi:hypothetical protein